MKQIEFSFQCPESVEDMEKSGDKFKCISCKRKIHDFTKDSNEEFQQKVKDSTEEICGVFRKDQVKNPRTSKMTALFRLAFAMVFVFGMNLNSFAQDSLITAVSNDTIQVLPIQAEEENYTITGKIRDKETGEFLPFVKLYIEKNGEKVAGATSGFEGEYTLIIPKEIVDDLIHLEVRYVGYVPRTIDVVMGSKEKVIYDIELDNHLEMLAGVLIITKTESLIDKDPYSFGKTTISRDEIRRGF